MVDYGEIFPESIPGIWERHRVLSWLRDTAVAHYHGLAGRRHTRRLRALPPEAIPVVIINFNRLEAVARLVDWLGGLHPAPPVFILDNHSTYPPLLRYYEQVRQRGVEVIALPDNKGTRATLRLATALRRFPKYIITDGDLVPYPSTPADVLHKLAAVLDRYPAYNHVGVSLELNDVPACYPFRELVLTWETQYWERPLAADVYEAAVDTTFAMYRGGSNLRRTTPGLRLARPYTLQHVDWYVDPAAISDEYRNYLLTCSPVATWTTKLRTALGVQLPTEAPA